MHTELLEQSFEIMGKGMLGIFLALTIIYFFVLALSLVSKYLPDKKDNEE